MNTSKINSLAAAFKAAINEAKPPGAGAAMPQWAADTTGAGLPMSVERLAAAWYAGDTLDGMAALLATGAGAVVEVMRDGKLVKAWRDDSALHRQASGDAAMSRKFAQLVRRKMVASGRHVSKATEDDGAAAGAAAVIAWRNGQTEVPILKDKAQWAIADEGGIVKAGARVADAVAVIAWRAVVNEMSADDLGNSIELSSVSDDWIAQAVTPGAFVAVAGIESRDDKARRWLAERATARAKLTVHSRLDLFKAGASRRRVDLVDKIERACTLLIAGASVDDAALQVGFNPSGQTSAGDRLARAVRALGLRYQLTARQRGDVDDTGEKSHLGAAVDLARLFVPVVQPVAQLAARATGAAGRHCGAACLMAAGVRAVGRSSSSLTRGVARRRDNGALRFEWSQLSPVARLAALPAGQRAALLAVSSGRAPSVARRGLLACDVELSKAAINFDCATLPNVARRALGGEVTRIGKAINRRKLRGVLRSVKA